MATAVRTLRTPDDVIKALGGTTNAAKILGLNKATVSLWRSRGIPAEYFIRITDLLLYKYNVSPKAFSMYLPLAKVPTNVL